MGCPLDPQTSAILGPTLVLSGHHWLADLHFLESLTGSWIAPTVLVWLTKGSLLLTDQLESTLLQTEATESGRCTPPLITQCTPWAWLVATPFIFLFASSQSVTERLVAGQGT